MEIMLIIKLSQSNYCVMTCFMIIN